MGLADLLRKLSLHLHYRWGAVSPSLDYGLLPPNHLRSSDLLSVGALVSLDGLFFLDMVGYLSLHDVCVDHVDDALLATAVLTPLHALPRPAILPKVGRVCSEVLYLMSETVVVRDADPASALAPRIGLSAVPLNYLLDCSSLSCFLFNDHILVASRYTRDPFDNIGVPNPCLVIGLLSVEAVNNFGIARSNDIGSGIIADRNSMARIADSVLI